jgi:hypothetical protein
LFLALADIRKADLHIQPGNFWNVPILLKNCKIWMAEFPVENQINLHFAG